MAGCDLWLKRDDLIHPIVSGNKWRKLVGFVEQLPPSATVLTFGGAHSNHLAAAATCLQTQGHQGIFIIRGDELNPKSSPALHHCQAAGMHLIFISRTSFRQLREQHWQPSTRQQQAWQLPQDYQLLAEGGSGPHNSQGCQALWQELEQAGRPDHLWLAAGTGGTARGLLRAMPHDCPTHITLVSAVKGSHREAAQTQALADDKQIKLTWIDETYFGGFAKTNAQLQQAQLAFEAATGILLDPVYNAKVWWHLSQQPRPQQGKIVWLHTGGFRPQLIPEKI